MNNKIKIIKKLGMTQIEIKGLKGQQLNDADIQAINTNQVHGLLRLEQARKMGSFKLIYNITGYVTLKEFLNIPMNKDSFTRLLEGVLDCLISMEKHHFHKENLLFSFDKVVVNPGTQKVHFVYVPIQGFDSGESLREFLLNIIQCATFAPGEDSSYVTEYINILNSGINFSSFELEEYVSKLSGRQVRKKTVNCPGCREVLPAGTNFCPKCGMKITGATGNTGNSGKGVYDPLKGTVVTTQEPEMERPKDSTQGLSTGTTVLKISNPTVCLKSETLYEQVYPYLIQKKNNVKTSIKVPCFKVGKENGKNDCVITDNNAVSREHACIITKESRYYVKDLGSTNSTYVDNRVIPANTEIEIFHGTALRFANEDFVFYIDEERSGE